MRWRFCLLALLFFGAVGAIVYATSQVQKEANSVTVNHTLLEGDPAAADGLVLKWHSGDYSLCWDTIYHLGAQPVYQTDFSFQGIPSGYRQDSPGYITEFGAFPQWYGDTGSPGFEYYYTSMELKKETGFMARLVNAVAGRMESGVFERSERLCVADYYDTFPLYGDRAYLLDAKGDNERTFQACFSIPVPEDFWLDITVRKDPYDNTLSAAFQAPSRDTAPTLHGILLEDMVYFYFLPVEGELDFSQLKDGFGIYQAPYRQNETPRILASELQCVYPLDPKTVQIEYLKLSQDLSHVFLVTCEEDSRVFIILRRDTMKSVTQTVLPEGAPVQSIYQVPGGVPDEGENYLALFEDNSFCFFVLDTQGALLSKFQGELWRDLPDAHLPEYPQLRFSTAAYDVGRLAILGADQPTKALYLQIYDSQGLSYAGRYDSSLYDFNYEDGEPMEYDPIWEPGESLSRNYQLIWQMPAQ